MYEINISGLTFIKINLKKFLLEIRNTFVAYLQFFSNIYKILKSLVQTFLFLTVGEYMKNKLNVYNVSYLNIIFW